LKSALWARNFDTKVSDSKAYCTIWSQMRIRKIFMYHKEKHSPTRISKTWKTHQQRYRTSS
jgi:hypothetical protein